MKKKAKTTGRARAMLLEKPYQPDTRAEQLEMEEMLPADQPNNLAHGFYSRHFSRVEDDDLDAADTIDLDAEIKMLMVALRRLFRQMKAAGSFLDQTVQLDALGKNSVRLAQMVKIKHDLAGQAGSIDTALDQAISAALEEMKSSTG